MSFYHDLQERFQAPGEFAQAYVIAHEVGHHVQNLLGISDKVHAAQARGSQANGNALSVRMEFRPIVWLGSGLRTLTASGTSSKRGDMEAGLNAASQIGDDRMQMRARGYVSPESFTHGSSQQRVHWFKQGLDSGDLSQCDTFGSPARRPARGASRAETPFGPTSAPTKDRDRRRRRHAWDAQSRSVQAGDASQYRQHAPAARPPVGTSGLSSILTAMSNGKCVAHDLPEARVKFVVEPSLETADPDGAR